MKYDILHVMIICCVLTFFISEEELESWLIGKYQVLIRYLFHDVIGKEDDSLNLNVVHLDDLTALPTWRQIQKVMAKKTRTELCLSI